MESEKINIEIQNALKGEQSAYNHIVNRFSDMLHIYVTSLCEEEEEAKDICQEAFNKAFSSLKSYDSKYAFSTWLFSIAYNCFVDHDRKNTSIKSGQQQNLTSQDWENIVTSDTSNPEYKLISSQETDKIMEEIDRLDPKYSVIAKMRFVDGYAYEEIADKLDMPINTVRTRIKRAREILAQRYIKRQK